MNWKSLISKKLSDPDLARLVMRYGFPDPVLAVAIILAESGGDPGAVNTKGNSPPSRDRGLWQINDFWHGPNVKPPTVPVTDAEAFDPDLATRAAFKISNRGTNFTQWSAYKYKTYINFLPRAERAVKDVQAGARGMFSKISFHLSAYPTGIYDQVGRAGLKGIKVYQMDSDMNLDELRRAIPGALIDFRFFTQENYDSISPEGFVNRIVQAGLLGPGGKLAGRGLIWEGINEPIVKLPEEFQRLNTWYVKFAEIMHGMGEKTAAFSFSTGNPEPKYLQYAVYLEEAIAANDFIALHEYHTNFGHYRMIWQALPVKKPIIITETGYDAGGQQIDGWRNALSPNSYIELMFQYDAMLLQDPYVLFATIFQVADPASWQSFDIVDVVPAFVDGIAARGGGAPLNYSVPPTIPPTIPPETLPGIDRVKLAQIAGVTRQIAARLATEAKNVEGAANYIDKLLKESK